MTARSLSPFPHPPDIERIEIESGPVRFRAQPFGREVACIGSNPVGSIEPAPWGRMTRASFRCSLFEGGIGRADSIAKAKIALLHRIADWHDLAGPLYAELAMLIRLQADGVGT